MRRRRNRIQRHILQRLSALARIERRAREILLDPKGRATVLGGIQASREEFIRETIPALYGER